MLEEKDFLDGWSAAKKDGYVLFPTCTEKNIEKLINILRSENIVAQRDVVVSSSPSPHDLRAERSDFDFHSDAVFLETPPKWILILVVVAEDGGSIEIMNTNKLCEAENEVDMRFVYGTDTQNITASLCNKYVSGVAVRYRKDYMREVVKGDLQIISERVHSMSDEVISLGELKGGTALLLNNWKFLHRRKKFSGVRTIRRIWFFEQGKI